MRSLIVLLILLTGCIYTPLPPSDECEAFLRECGAIEERLTVLRERIAIINNRTSTGQATISYYADFFEGRLTASGIVFHQDERQIAHRSLPFGTIVVLTSYGGAGECYQAQANNADAAKGRPTGLHPASTYGIVTDRGPFIKGREFDVSKLIARELGMEEQGVVDCEVLIVKGEGK